MKHILLCFVCAISLSSCIVQRSVSYSPKIIDEKLEGILPVVDGKVYYSMTRNVPEANAERIFRAARRWGALRVDTPSSILGLSDSKTFDVIGSYTIPSFSSKPKMGKGYEVPFVSPKINCAVIIECNNNSYRVTLGNFKKDLIVSGTLYKGYESLEGLFGGSKVEYIETLKYVERNVFDLIESLDRLIQRDSKQ